ncbi:MAG: PEP-utilizing enzyme [Sporichthyaceae bacterium]
MAIQVDPTGTLHTESTPGHFWSTTNLGEALPGVASHLGWSLWRKADLGIRDCFVRLGALPRSEVKIYDDPDKRTVGIFYGRAALNVNFFCEMGGLLPGSGPDAIAKQLLGEVPEGVPLARSKRRLGHVLRRMPKEMITIRKDVLSRAEPMHAWWESTVPKLATMDEASARATLAEADDRFTEAIKIQAGGVFIGVQGVYDQLLTLINKAGLDAAQANAITAGQGSHAETEIIFDLWRLGNDKLDLASFLSRHGYHGPSVGEMSSVSWREDPSPIERLAAQYRGRPDPHVQADERVRARIAAEADLLAKLPRSRRAGAKLVLKMAVARIPLRGVAKATYLQVMDIARGSARRLGDLLSADGRLADREDVFLFTVEELTRGQYPADMRALADERRAQREEFKRHDIPTHWDGVPTPFELEPLGTGSEAGAEGDVVEGIGASGGVIEGPVRIVHDPAFSEIEPDEILVCVTTDPSWAAVLYVSSALVTDIGGLLSHAAVVAREIGVPAVVGTGNGTKVLCDGDLVRVDGNAGTITILKRAAGSES